MSSAETRDAEEIDEFYAEQARHVATIADHFDMGTEEAVMLAHQAELADLNRRLASLGGLAEFSQTVSRLIELIEKRHDNTTDAGRGDAARVRLGPLIRGVDISFRSTGSSQMTVEVSNDGFEWEPFDTQSLNDDQDVFQYDVPWLWVRSFADQNLSEIHVSAGGFQ